MLALCLMLSSTYYAKNYAGIIGRGLPGKTNLICNVKVLSSHVTYYNAVILFSSCNTSNKAVTYDDCTIRVYQCAIDTIIKI